MSNSWSNKIFGRPAAEYLTSAREYMVSLCNDVVQKQIQQQQQQTNNPTGGGLRMIEEFVENSKTEGSTVDDYHPNTPSSSTADEKDALERDISEELPSDKSVDVTKTQIPYESYDDLPTAIHGGGSGDKFVISFRDSSNSSDSLKHHVTFFEPSVEAANAAVVKDPQSYVNNTKAVVINESDMSSDESASPKHAMATYERAGARPKYINRSSLGSYNSSNSAHSVILDHSAGVRSPFSTISRSPGWASKLYDYPILFVSPHGTIAVYLRESCIVEMTINKTIRVECQGKFSAATNSHGSINCILHPDGRILQQDTRVQCLFGKNKVASFGPQGVIFNMKPLPMAYVVSSTIFKGTTSVPANCMRLPPMDYDFTMTVFYNQSIVGPDTVPRCQEIVRQANYKFREDGAITVLINGVFIRQDRFGNVLVNSRPRTIRASPQKNTISVRTHFVDMAVQEDEKAYVKRGVKRVHVSKSGMVVSDGNCITSMDHFGRIVSST